MKYYVIELDGKPYNGVEPDGETYNNPIGGGYFSPTTRDRLMFGESDEPQIIAGSINLKSTIDRLLSRERSEGLIADNLTIRVVPKEYTAIAEKNNPNRVQFNIIQSIKASQDINPHLIRFLSERCDNHRISIITGTNDRPALDLWVLELLKEGYLLSKFVRKFAQNIELENWKKNDTEIW